MRPKPGNLKDARSKYLATWRISRLVACNTVDRLRVESRAGRHTIASWSSAQPSRSIGTTGQNTKNGNPGFASSTCISKTVVEFGLLTKQGHAGTVTCMPLSNMASPKDARFSALVRSGNSVYVVTILVGLVAPMQFCSCVLKFSFHRIKPSAKPEMGRRSFSCKWLGCTGRTAPRANICDARQ